jgi:hypothetical protein
MYMPSCNQSRQRKGGDLMRVRLKEGFMSGNSNSLSIYKPFFQALDDRQEVKGNYFERKRGKN